MNTTPPSPWSIKGPMRLGLLGVLVLVGGFGTWATQSSIAGAVVASGLIEVDQNRQAIQHPDGGVVAELLVDEGSEVASGEVVMRLDASEIASEFAVVSGRLNEIRARRARLEAERDGSDALTLPGDILEAAEGSPELADIVAGQINLFEARVATMNREIEQLDRRKDQIAAQIEGLAAQRVAAVRQQELTAEDLATQQDLRERGLGQAARVLALQREEADLLGSVAEIDAGIAQAEGRRTEIDLSILRMENERREEAIAELREVRAEEEELSERARALSRRLERMDLRAPVSGVVYGLTVFGTQSVVRGAEPLMFLVPQDQPLVISARVESIHVDQVFVGQEAILRFPAFDTRTTPELFGEVTRVSADAFQDEATGLSYYETELELNPGEIERLAGETLLPGMPVEAFIRTEDRTPLAYLLRPLTDYFNRAFRET